MKLSLNTKTGLAAMRSACNNENGAALVIALMFMAILGLLGSTAVVLTTTDMKIGSNYRSSVQSYNIAKAGIEEVVHRMGLPTTGNTNYIGEGPGIGPTPGWGVYVVSPGANPSIDDPDWDGSFPFYNDGDDATDPEPASLQTELNYLVKTHYKMEDTQFYNGTINNEVVLYGQDWGYGSKAPAIGTQPVWVVTSIGTSNSNNSKTVITGDYARFTLNMEAKAALSCDHPVSLGGTTLVSGFNHDITTTPADDGRSTTDIDSADLTLDCNGIDNHGGAERYDNTNYDDFDTLLQPGEDTDPANPRLDDVRIMYGDKIETNPTTYVPGVWTTGDTVAQSGTDDIYGGNSTLPTAAFPWLGAFPAGTPYPPPTKSWKDVGRPAGCTFPLTGPDPPTSWAEVPWPENEWLPLWEYLGFGSLEDLLEMLKRADVTMEDTTPAGGNLWLDVAPVGLTYIDNASSGALKFSTHVDGSGLMIVTGDLDANNLYFKGLIYVQGSVSLAASFWLLGAMLVEGVDPVGSGGGQILYSKEALDQEVSDAIKYIPICLADESLIP